MKRLITKIVGKNIRRKRIEKGMSQLAVELEAGMSMGHLTDIELGKVNARILTLLRIARALDVDVKAFFES